MKKFIPILVVMLFATLSLFAGCASKTPTPASTDPVFGNGGLSVIKGDYIYYVNGYESNETTKNGHVNKKGDVKVSSIYVAKIQNGVLSDKKELVSKVGGFEYSDLYVFGNTLYFLSPNTKKDETGEVRTDIITLCSIKLDGSKFSEIYTPTQYSSGAFSMKEINGRLYAFVFDGEKLLQIEPNNNRVTIIAEGVTSFATSLDKTCYSENAQNSVNTSLDGMLFYSRSRDEQDAFGGNVFELYDINLGKKTILQSNIGTTVKVASVEGGRVFYTKDSCYYSMDSTFSNELRHTWVEVENFVPLGQGDRSEELGIVVKYNSKLYLQKLTDSILSQENILSEENLTIISKDQDKLIVKDSNSKIISISTKDKSTTTLFEPEQDQTLGDKFDFDGRYIIMFSSVADYNSNYSFIVDTFGAAGGKISATQIGTNVDSDKK